MYSNGQIPLYYSNITGKICIFSTPVHIQNVSSYIYGKIPRNMICSITIKEYINGLKEKKINNFNFITNLIYPSYDIGDLGEIWKFIGYYNIMNENIICNNLIREKYSIDMMIQELYSISLIAKFEEFSRLLHNILNDDILSIIKEYLIPKSLADI